MTQIVETTTPLTAEERRQVQDFAEFLISRRNGNSPQAEKPKGIDVDGLIGLCKGMGGDKSDKELVREAWDDLLKKYD